MKRHLRYGPALAFLVATLGSAPASARDPVVEAVFPEAAALPAKQSMQVFGQTIRYYDIGHGPVVVLLHGTGDRAESWSKVIPALARTHRVIATDQLGFGDSDKPLIAYRIETWTNMLGEMLRLKSIGAFSLVGESLGGWIAAQYVLHAAADPGHYPAPGKLVLTDAGGIRPRVEPGNRTGAAPGTSIEGTVAGLRTAYHDPKYASREAAAARFALTMRTGAGYTIQSFSAGLPSSGEYVDEDLGRIRIPTLVVWGEDDRIVPVASARAFVNGIAGARAAPIADCGHLPPVEQPQAYLKALLPFLDS